MYNGWRGQVTDRHILEHAAATMAHFEIVGPHSGA
jgi:hypothetical protein